MNDCARDYVYSLTLRIWEGHEAVATIAKSELQQRRMERVVEE